APGRLALGDTALALGSSALALDPDAATLSLEPLVLSPLAADGSVAGTATLHGTVATDGGANELALALEALALPGEAGGGLDGSGRWAGTAAAWQLRFAGTLAHPDATLPLELEGHGDRDALALTRFRVGGGGGELLAGHGRVQWAPSLALSFDADLADFDPSRFHGDWPGALSGALQVEASRDDDAGWRALLTIERLQGRLRGRAVRGQGRLHWGDASAGTDLALALGDSRLR